MAASGFFLNFLNTYKSHFSFFNRGSTWAWEPKMFTPSQHTGEDKNKTGHRHECLIILSMGNYLHHLPYVQHKFTSRFRAFWKFVAWNIKQGSSLGSNLTNTVWCPSQRILIFQQDQSKIACTHTRQYRLSYVKCLMSKQLEIQQKLLCPM